MLGARPPLPRFCYTPTIVQQVIDSGASLRLQWKVVIGATSLHSLRRTGKNRKKPKSKHSGVDFQAAPTRNGADDTGCIMYCGK